MLAEKNNEIAEIRFAEERRAQKVMKDNRLTQWVQQLRKKYIADGFLMPFYGWDGKYSRSRERIKKFGDFILPYDNVGEVFHRETYNDWIHQESMWFWEYLVSGQQAIFAKELSELPEHIRLGDMPAHAVWQELVQIATQMGCFGENGGGILLSPRDLDAEQLDYMRKQDLWKDGEDGYLELYPRLSRPLWIDRFQNYEQIEGPEMEIEMRPAWFHLANYAFFNVTITRLPVFLGVFKEEGKIDRFRFLDDDLSERIRDFIVKALLSMPIKLKKQLDVDAIRKERQDMTWWLWHKVGHREYKRTLSYHEIADIAKTPRSSIQTAVERFGRKLKEKLDCKLLERLLRVSSNLGLGYNMTYHALVRQGLAPVREREIDSFDELDSLI